MLCTTCITVHLSEQPTVPALNIGRLRQVPLDMQPRDIITPVKTEHATYPSVSAPTIDDTLIYDPVSPDVSISICVVMEGLHRPRCCPWQALGEHLLAP